MRCTQYIGLTDAARDFVKKLKEASAKFPPNVTHGMFEEEIPLGIWEAAGNLFVEVEQASPWSSGPMIFTHLRVRSLICLEDMYAFSWVEDPTVVGQVDQKNGRYWV